MRHNLKIILPFVVLLTTSALFYYLLTSKAERNQPQLKEKVWQVEVIAAQKQTLSPGITLYGRVESPEQLQSAAPGAGIVELLKVRSGDIVNRDDLLLALDRRDFDSQYIQAKSDLDEATGQITELELRHKSNQLALKTERELVQLAEQEVERMRKLKNQKLGAESVLSEARSELGRQQLSRQTRQFEVDSFASRKQMLEAKKARLEAILDEIQLKTERSQVTAPFDGIIESVPVSVGDRVAVGQILVSLYPVDSLEIRAHIPFRYVADIQAVLSNGGSPTAVLKRGIETLQFNLKRLSGEATPTGLDAFFDTASHSRSMRPGQLLTLNLSLPAQRDVIEIPFQAIYGNSRIYLMRQGRLFGVDVQTVGQYLNANNQTRLLIKSDEVNDSDAIVVTHLPNAVTGLKIETPNDIIEQ